MVNQVTVNTTGQIDVNPRIPRMVFPNNTLAEVTAAGFLNQQTLPAPLVETDLVLLSYDTGISFFEVAISNSNVITLSVADASDTTLPTVNNHLAVFKNTTGGLKPGSLTAINPGSLTLEVTDSPVYLYIKAPADDKGRLLITATDNVGDTNITITNTPHGQETGYYIPDIGEAVGFFLGCKITPDPASNLVTFDTQVTALNLAAGAVFPLYVASDFAQYRVRSLQVNRGGTNFSGGGGDRLAEITDGTTSYSIIPAASLQTLANTQWGVAGLPNPASAAINTETAVGANLSIRYSGGTADYTTGTFTVSGVLEKTA